MPRIFTLLACPILVSAALLGCSFSPARDATPVAPVYEVPPHTWSEVYEAIFAASIAAADEAGAYARNAMEEWIEKVRQRTEADFVAWYCGYWTQQWLGLKAAWYQTNQSDGGATTAQQLAAYLQVQYDSRVLQPVRRELDPDKVMDDAASAYMHALREDLQSLPDRYHVPLDQLHEKLAKIPAIVSASDPRQDASLYQLIQTGDITQIPAYVALVAPVRSAGGAISFRPLTDRLGTVVASTADRSAGKLAVRGTATAASAALGGVGILLGMGFTAWGAIEHSRERPALEAEIRQELRAGLDAVWNQVLANFDSTVLGAVHHISSNIDISLLSPQTRYGALLH